MAKLCPIFVVILLSHIHLAFCYEVRVTIPQGKLAGTWETSLTGAEYASFVGIPYAKPPVGKYRFEEPIPAKGWRGVYQAKLYPNSCLQWFQIYDDDPGSVTGDEDCLYLNVYTPNLNHEKELLPVLVYIHGGSFLYGAGIQYQPTYMMDHNVIYVSINYRVGPLGFLSTQDNVVPGNNGLKDQNLALRWVRSNIAYFGGDSQQVTIMGMSAGGASVHYHMLSKKSHHLFHGAISQSGTSFCPWTQQKKPREKAFQLGAYLGCPVNSSEEMITCLKLRPASAIVRTVQLEFMVFEHTPFAPFAPVIEPEDSPNAFIKEHPYKTISEGNVLDVPWMASVVTEEGLYPGGVYLHDIDNLAKINAKWEEWVPHIYDFNYTLPRQKHVKAARMIKQHYLKGKPLSLNTISGFIDSLSDRHFVVCVDETVRLQSTINKKPTFAYVFGYTGATSLGMTLSKSSVPYGVSHGDDTGYSLDTTYMDPTTTESDRRMIEYKTNLIASFVITGQPDAGIVKFDPVEIEKGYINYLKINSPTDVRMERAKSLGDTNFWDSLGILENEALFDIVENDEL